MATQETHNIAPPTESEAWVSDLGRQLIQSVEVTIGGRDYPVVNGVCHVDPMEFWFVKEEEKEKNPKK